MSRPETQASKGSPPDGLFVTTRWSVVLAAKDRDSPTSGAALEALCRQYWYPLYAFVRGSGYSAHDAQDLTQEFFARLLERDYLRTVEPEKGRFRTFLRMALRRFLANEWHRARTQKRGGGHHVISFDSTLAESRLAADPPGISPDQAYDRRWALALLWQVTERLEGEYAQAGRPQECQVLRPRLFAERGTIPYEEIGRQLGVSAGAARVATHRFRRRFRELFRQAVAATVADPDQVDAEVRHVLAMLSEG